MKSIGLYLHFPFCIKKCHYCDFPSYEGIGHFMEPYLDALCKEILSYKPVSENYKIETIFLGGGTPTIFDAEKVGKVLSVCYEAFNIAPNPEVTIECNPGTVDFKKLQKMRGLGINRLSIGLQAWQDKHLQSLGRIHTSSDFLETFAAARKAGFFNINTDLIFGLPDQTLDEWLETIDQVASLGVEHISVYSLIIEEGTRLYENYKKGQLKLPDEDEERKMYHLGVEKLRAFGLLQYEISNFAKEGMECAHNLNYWLNGEYIGCGCGASSHLNGKRYTNNALVKEYINSISEDKSSVTFEEKADIKTQILETIMLGFRLTKGINDTDFYNRFGFHIRERYAHIIKDLEGKGLITIYNDNIMPTRKGLDYQNAIALAFMGD